MFIKIFLTTDYFYLKNFEKSPSAGRSANISFVSGDLGPYLQTPTASGGWMLSHTPVFLFFKILL